MIGDGGKDVDTRRSLEVHCFGSNCGPPARSAMLSIVSLASVPHGRWKWNG